LAVFDLDGTLVNSDTFLPFLVSYAWRRRCWIPLLTLSFWLALYACRLLSDRAAKERVLISFLRGQPRSHVSQHAEWFCEAWVRRRLQDEVLERLRKHQQAGDRVILLSASPDVYVTAIGRMLGIDEVVCTEVVGSELTWDGSLRGENCKGAHKVQRLAQYLEATSPPTGSWAYGDSSSDLPLLQWVDNGVLLQHGRMRLISERAGTAARAPFGVQ
jgi:phosphatidylglycerophosphatase C